MSSCNNCKCGKCPKAEAKPVQSSKADPWVRLNADVAKLKDAIARLDAELARMKGEGK